MGVVGLGEREGETLGELQGVLEGDCVGNFVGETETEGVGGWEADIEGDDDLVGVGEREGEADGKGAQIVKLLQARFHKHRS